MQADARVVARLYEALADDHEVLVCSSWEALQRSLGRRSFDGCLVDADHPNRHIAAREIARLRDEQPGLAVIACVEEGYALAYYDLGGLGVAGIVAAGAQAPAVRSIVDRALATARADGIARGLEGRFASPGTVAIGWAVEHAGPDTSVEKLAAALGHTPRSLRQALEDAGLPGPTRVLLWGRLLLAGARLGRDGRTVEDVAFSLGYATATSLARAMKSQTGLTPREISEHGGMERVRDALFPDDDRGRPPRNRLGRIACVALLAALQASCASLGVGGGGVDRSAIDAVLEAEPLDRAHFGVMAVDARTGRTLYQRNEQQWFVPASNQKILVTAAAWTRLGAEHRFRTEVWAAGQLSGGVLDGDLVVIGSGDPSLSDRFWEWGFAALRALADSIDAAGVRHVTGSLLIDVSAWDSTTVAPTREVDDLAFDYGATGGAFAIDEGELDVIVRAGPWVGLPADVDWTARVDEGMVVSRIQTVPEGQGRRIVARYQPETRRIELVGAIEVGTVDSLAIAQRDPVRLATAVLARALEHAGISVAQGSAVRWTPGEPIGSNCLAGAVRGCPRARVLTAIESPPLRELVRVVLEPSQNWVSEQLLLALGAAQGERGSWPEGLRLMHEFLHDDVGIDSLDVSARDGSGLSAYNLVTPRALVRVLGYMAARPDAAAYRAAMPEPGEEDSTLEERLPGLEGRVFAKTGTISNVNSLSGYLVRENGQEVIFSILANGAGLDDEIVEQGIDDIVRILAR
ncbi:MAG: D-alanyl-D-alanine carboxypeptidase/D-alanyl-D-alanine-endopeptidase [Gemmatimonadetes bacterium]|nr:D-alanyl-D-alanine carboxypeptidase/D-alanyl-D-alanine-endopeptidase [Gemmatimonadota bacterium]